MKSRYEVVVIGDGPAGNVAAFEAARAGVKTLLLEENLNVGIPVQCGEGVSDNVFQNFGLRPTKDIVSREVHKFKVIFPNGTFIYMKSKGFVLNRDRFDQYLADRAVDAGAELYTSAKVTTINPKSRTINVNFKGESREINAEVIIGCDGVKSNVAAWAGLRDHKRWVSSLVRAYEYRVKGIETEAVEAYILPEISPGGYCWVFPKEDSVNVGIATIAKNSKERLNMFINKFGLKGQIEKVIAGAIPSKGPIKKTFTDGILIAGDAAGHTNPIFFGGIYTAMICGRLAGSVASEALIHEDTSSKFLRVYEDRWRGLPLADPILLEAARVIYSMSAARLNKIGSLFGGKEITQLRRLEKLILFSKILLPKNWSVLVMLNDFNKMIKGLKITKRWGW